MGRFTYEDAEGTTRFKAWALPLTVAAICIPIVAAFGITSQGSAVGFAMAAAVATLIIVLAVRSKPFGPMEVGGTRDGERRVLVLATEEVGAASAARVAELASGADDVRIVVATPSRRLDRWLSGDDAARGQAQDWLARSAGALTAQGLRVSGSVGDADPAQAVADELRSFAADEVVVVSDEAHGDQIEALRHRLALPLTRVSSG